jgi:hypothetical protein
VIGSVAGYLIRGLRHTVRVAEIERVWQSRLAQRDQELAMLRVRAEPPTVVAADSNSLQPNVKDSTPIRIAELHNAPQPSADASQFENKLSDVLNLIEKLAQSQQRMENELASLKPGTPHEFKSESPNPKP